MHTAKPYFSDALTFGLHLNGSGRPASMLTAYNLSHTSLVLTAAINLEAI
jgi:hypothetical protein